MVNKSVLIALAMMMVQVDVYSSGFAKYGQKRHGENGFISNRDQRVRKLLNWSDHLYPEYDADMHNGISVEDFMAHEIYYHVMNSSNKIDVRNAIDYFYNKHSQLLVDPLEKNNENHKRRLAILDKVCFYLDNNQRPYLSEEQQIAQKKDVKKFLFVSNNQELLIQKNQESQITKDINAVLNNFDASPEDMKSQIVRYVSLVDCEKKDVDEWRNHTIDYSRKKGVLKTIAIENKLLAEQAEKDNDFSGAQKYRRNQDICEQTLAMIEPGMFMPGQKQFQILMQPLGHVSDTYDFTDNGGEVAQTNASMKRIVKNICDDSIDSNV